MDVFTIFTLNIDIKTGNFVNDMIYLPAVCLFPASKTPPCPTTSHSFQNYKTYSSSTPIEHLTEIQK